MITLKTLKKYNIIFKIDFWEGLINFLVYDLITFSVVPNESNNERSSIIRPFIK